MQNFRKAAYVERQTDGNKSKKKTKSFDLIRILTTESRVCSKLDSSACLKLKKNERIISYCTQFFAAD